jgi:hypothetical protein
MPAPVTDVGDYLEYRAQGTYEGTRNTPFQTANDKTYQPHFTFKLKPSNQPIDHSSRVTFDNGTGGGKYVSLKPVKVGKV